MVTLIELDDGKIETGKPDQFDGKNHGFRMFPVKIFPNKPIHWYTLYKHDFSIFFNHAKQLVRPQQDTVPSQSSNRNRFRSKVDGEHPWEVTTAAVWNGTPFGGIAKCVMFDFRYN